MKILYVTLFPLETNTSGNIRNIGLIQGLRDCGHKIHTCTLAPDESSFNYDNSMKSFSTLIEKSFYIPPHPLYKQFRGKKSSEYSNNSQDFKLQKHLVKFIRNILKVLRSHFWVYDVQKLNVKNLNMVSLDGDYDLIISSSDPKASHLLGEQIRKKLPGSVRWIQYWGDPMKEDITVAHNMFKDTMMKHEELRLLKLADSVIYTSPLTLLIQKKLYPSQQNKMDYSVQPCISSFSKSERNQIPQVGYFGDYHSKVRNIKPLWDCIGKTNLHLIIAGLGDMPSPPHPNITILNRLPYSDIQQLEQKSDILVGLCNIKGTQIPGKFYYMAGYQKPIIIIIDGSYKEELTAFFKTFHRYIVCNNTPESIILGLQTALKEISEDKHYYLPEELLPQKTAEKILNGGH